MEESKGKGFGGKETGTEKKHPSQYEEGRATGFALSHKKKSWATSYRGEGSHVDAWVGENDQKIEKDIKEGSKKNKNQKGKGGSKKGGSQLALRERGFAKKS